ncbi:MAG: coenzyme F420-0:L-glutamate ligase [Chloroflexota bacterium]|nr:coenzyme F420-0:L-glutamate ligase [Chloroflexota bacterium]
MPPFVTLIGIAGLPEARAGDDLGTMLVQAAAAQGTPIAPGDVLVVTQKVVSKAEGRVIDLRTVRPSDLAERFAAAWEKDARVVETALREASRVVRMEGGVLITETRHGFRCANSGVDASNAGGADLAVLLPLDPDASAQGIRERVRELTRAEAAVVISDTFGRPWREGAENVAIGVAGMEAVLDYRGQYDDDGRELRSTTIAVADEIAAAAELVTNKLTRTPAAIVRGYPYQPGESGAAPLVRAREKDLFP